MAEIIRQSFTPEEYDRAAHVINQAPPGIGNPTSEAIYEDLAKITQAKAWLQQSLHLPIDDINLALAVHASVNPSRKNPAEPDQVRDWLEEQKKLLWKRCNSHKVYYLEDL